MMVRIKLKWLKKHYFERLNMVSPGVAMNRASRVSGKNLRKIEVL